MTTGASTSTSSSTSTYTRFEILRTFRNTRFFVFTLGFPIVLYLLVAGPNRDAVLGGISFPLYYMTGMVAWGTMMAVIGGGARIATERSVGWNRQLRITPLRPRVYFRAKVVTGYAMACITIVSLYLCGTMLGVRLSAGSWLTMTGLILVGLIPFAAMGILLGHLLTVDSMGPAMGGITALFALLGGAWGPIASTGALHSIALALPSYWLVQAGQSALDGEGWPPEGWIVIAVWTIVLTRVAMIVYRRDTSRV
jgi:ABC-2 type transport system permease protein